MFSSARDGIAVCNALEKEMWGRGLVFVVTACVMGGDARHVFRGISKIGFASGRHSLTPGRWVSSRSVLGVASVLVSSRRPSASGPIPPPPEVSQFFGLGPELCVL